MAMPLSDSELRSRDTTNALRGIKNWPLISSSSHPAPTTLGRSLGRRPNFSVLVIHRVVLAKLTTRKSDGFVLSCKRTHRLAARTHEAPRSRQ
jgi:hypothetical protein